MQQYRVQIHDSNGKRTFVITAASKVDAERRARELAKSMDEGASAGRSRRLPGMHYRTA